MKVLRVFFSFCLNLFDGFLVTEIIPRDNDIYNVIEKKKHNTTIRICMGKFNRGDFI